ncbi:MAG: hypothetical protein NC388_07545 [Clostridium sp.]|nr:hypothetical protein [Clostridium sp.]
MITFVLGIIGSLLSLRYGNTITGYLKTTRVWWCAVAGLITVVIFLLLWSCHLHWAALIFAFVTITVLGSTLFVLPFEKRIIKRVASADGKSPWILTTPGKLAYEFQKLQFCKEKDKQDAWYRFYHLLKRHELFQHETDRYYILTLEEMFRMGAIKLVKEESNTLESKTGDNPHLLHLKALVANAELRINDMCDILSQYIAHPSISFKDKIFANLNMLCAANEKNDRLMYQNCISFAEDAYFNHNVRNIPTLTFDLLYYYDQNGMTDKAGQIVKDIKNRTYTNIASLYDYTDMLFQHYRAHNDREGQAEALNMIYERAASTIEDDEESRMYINLSMLNPLFNINTSWKEFSREIFKNSQSYLTHSARMAATFMSECTKLLREADTVYNLSINQDEYNRLINEFKAAIIRWEPEIRREIAGTPPEQLYKRKTLYMHLVDFACIKYDGTDHIIKLFEEKLAIIESIINECRRNGAVRETLHFLNVYCDEVLTVHQQIVTNPGNIASTEMECYKNKYEQFYKPLAERHISEMEEIISPNYFNKSLHFYVLYLSHYNLLSGNTGKGTYYFHLFESYRIDTSYFNTVIQQMYSNIKAYVYKQSIKNN